MFLSVLVVQELPVLWNLHYLCMGSVRVVYVSYEAVV